MATVRLAPSPRVQFLSDLGEIVPGGLLYAYAAGTTTPQNTYTSSTGGVANANPVVLDAAGRSTVWLDVALAYKLVFKTAAGVTIWSEDNITVGDAPGLVVTLALSSGSAGIGFIQSGTGAVATTVQTKLRYSTPVSVFDFMTSAEIADVLAYTRLIDVTAAVQAAMDAAWSSNRDCLAPAGAYRVTGLTLPGNSNYRTRAFRLYGQGGGELFARDYTGGTIFYSVTDAPVLKYETDSPNTGSGNVEIDHIRFEGNSTTPVVHLESLYAQSSFHHNGVYQAGSGDGLRVELSNTIEIHNNYFLNDDWNTTVLGSSRTGAGCRVFQTINTGLTTLRKNTSRGFKWGYILGDSITAMYTPKIEDCECSVNYNGILIQPNVGGASIADCYFEGGDQGIGVDDQGTYTAVTNATIFSGYSCCIDGSSVNRGRSYQDNTLSIGAVVNAVALKISGETRANGNSIARTTGTAGQKGIQITDAGPQISWADNFFDPGGEWTGSGAEAIDDNTTSGGIYGFGTHKAGGKTFPLVSRGAVSLGEGATLVDADVATNVLTVTAPYHLVTMVGAQTITSLSVLTNPDCMEYTFRTTNANASFTDSASLQMAGNATFTGPGTIRFLVDSGVAYELWRAAY